MKKKFFSIILLLLLYSSLIAQQRPSGIKILVKDKETGLAFMNDSMAVIFNDSIKQQFVSDKDGYAFFALEPGIYSVHVGHVGYQSQWISGIIIGEGKTSYITMELSNGKEQKVKKKHKKKKGGVRLKMVKN